MPAMDVELEIGTAFSDPVLQSQAAFRSIMSAMAEPGSITRMNLFDGPPLRLRCAMASVVLTLCDYETPVWLDQDFLSDPTVAAYIRFHTSARIVSRHEDASFALVARPEAMPSLSLFSLGTQEYPDRSTTVVVEVDRLEVDRGWQLSGPGIPGVSHLTAEPLPPDFGAQMRANRQLFPRGIDVILCCGERLAALPRSVRFEGED